ncbi:MAG: MOSC domain-containing protein, partial [Pyrinomonadaceae bacterium]
MFLSQINIYPIKSLRGISLEESEFDCRGLKFDRRWMLVDERNGFLTQRRYPKMATIGVIIEHDSLIAFTKDETLRIPFEPESKKVISVKVWESEVSAQVYGDTINDWFSSILRVKCKLVKMLDESVRKVNPKYAVSPHDEVSFADGYPFLLTNEASLADLNSRLEEPIPMNRFRPNLVVSGFEPFAEDSWKKIKIGEKEEIVAGIRNPNELTPIGVAESLEWILDNLAEDDEDVRIQRTRGNTYADIFKNIR